MARQLKGEITFLIEGKSISIDESPSESQLENELRELISEGHSLSMVLIFSRNADSVQRS